MKCEQAEQQTTAAEGAEVAKKNAEQQLAATLEALESSNNKIAELESLLAGRDAQVAELTCVHDTNSALEQELNTTKSKLAEAADCIEKLKQECSELKQSESNRTASVDSIVHELQESLDVTKQQLSVAEDEKQSVASQLEHVRQLLSDSVEKYSSLSEARTALQSDYDSMKQAFDQLREDYACSNDHTAAVVEECAMLKNTVENVTAQQNAVLVEKQALCQEIADLKESLNDSMERCEKLKTRQNLLCREVAELNHAVLDETLASSIDVTSVLSFSDSDISELFSKIRAEVAGLQNKLELQVGQMEDERQLREKVENEKAAMLQECDAVRASIHSLQEENKQLSSTIEQLESSQAELSVRCKGYESQVVQLQSELEADRTSHDAAEQVEKSDNCPNTTMLQKSVDEKDAEIERLHQEIRAYKLDIERLQQEREFRTEDKQPVLALALCTHENRNVESQNWDENAETQQQVADADIDKNSQGDVNDENQPSETAVELLNEGQDSGMELSEMKEKMAEWEAMMLMLQTEREEIQLELRKLEQQQKQTFGTIDEVLQCVLNSMKGRDLFPSNSEAISGSDGSDGELWSKLTLLKTVVDELVFEMDEMKEQIHHMTDEAKVSEQRVSELEVERTNLKEEAEEKTLKLQSLKESEDALKKREFELISEVEQMKASISETSKDLKDKDALLEKMQDLGSDSDKLNAQIELLHAEVASKDRLLSDTKVSEETVQQSLNEVKEQLRNSEQHLSSVESKYSAELAELQAEKDQLKEQIQHVTDETKVLEQRISELEMEQTNMKEEAEEKTLQLQSLKESEDALKKREFELVSEVEQMKAFISETSKDLKDKDALLAKMQDLGSDADKLNAEIELLHAEVASKDRLLSDTKVSEETLQQSLNEVKEQLRNSEQHLSSVESKYSVEIAELQAEKDQLSIKVNELQKDSDVMQQQSANVASDLQRKYDDKCNEATELNKAITTYCKEIEELKEWLKAEASEKEHLMAEHTKLAGALKELGVHLDQLRTETNDLSAAKITLEQKLCSLQEESDQKTKLSESQISQLEVSLSALQTDYEKSCERKSSVENELMDCTQKLDATSSRLLQAEDQCSQQAAELLQVRNELEQLKEECRVQAVQRSTSCESVENVQKSSDGGNVQTTVDSSTAQVGVHVMCAFVLMSS